MYINAYTWNLERDSNGDLDVESRVVGTVGEGVGGMNGESRMKKCGGKVKVAQSGPTLCNPKDYTVHGIFQARILEWVAFPFCRGSSRPRDRTQVSCIVGRFFTS